MGTRGVPVTDGHAGRAGDRWARGACRWPILPWNWALRCDRRVQLGVSRTCVYPAH